MKLIYQGKDIYDSILLKECVYESYCANHVNSLRLVVDDPDYKFEKYGIKPGEEIKVEKDNIKTGTLYINQIRPSGTSYELYCESVKKEYLCARSHKIWKNIMFKQIVKDMASLLKLSAEFHGVKDQKYKEIEQKSERDLVLVARLAILESCVVICRDKKMIVASEPYLEKMKPDYDLEIDSEYVTVDNVQPLKQCKVVSKDISGKYIANEGSGTMTISSIIPSTKGEADRFAKGLLRKVNKNAHTGIIETDELKSNISGGSIVNVVTDDHPDIEGNCIVARVRHDLVNDASKIWLRKCLKGY